MKTFACQPWRDADARFPLGKPLLTGAERAAMLLYEALLAATREALERELKWETITAVEVSVPLAPTA